MFVAIGSSFKFVCSAIILSKRKTRQRKEVSFVSRNCDEFKTPLRTKEKKKALIIRYHTQSKKKTTGKMLLRINLEDKYLQAN